MRKTRGQGAPGTGLPAPGSLYASLGLSLRGTRSRGRAQRASWGWRPPGDGPQGQGLGSAGTGNACARERRCPPLPLHLPCCLRALAFALAPLLAAYLLGTYAKLFTKQLVYRTSVTFALDSQPIL